jgi:hypothetical protein
VRRLQLSATAVDGELDAGDVGGVVGSKECHRCGDFFRLAKPLGLLRDNLDETGATIWVRRGGRVD